MSLPRREIKRSMPNRSPVIAKRRFAGKPLFGVLLDRLIRVKAVTLVEAREMEAKITPYHLVTDFDQLDRTPASARFACPGPRRSAKGPTRTRLRKDAKRPLSVLTNRFSTKMLATCDRCNIQSVTNVTFVKAPIRITEAEWEVMAVAWEHAPVAASTVVKVLEDRKQWTLATVRTLLPPS